MTESGKPGRPGQEPPHGQEPGGEHAGPQPSGQQPAGQPPAGTGPHGEQWPPPQPQHPGPQQQYPPPQQYPPAPPYPGPQQQYPPPQQYPPAPQYAYGPGYPPHTGAPQQLPSFPHREPMAYHQMLRTWTYAEWKPVLGIFICAVAMLVVMPLVLMPVLAIGVAIEGGPFWERFQEAATLQTVSPSALLYLNLVLASMIPVTWFVIRFVHRMRPRWLASVRPKLRWQFLFICLGIAVVALVAQVLIGTLLPGETEADFGPLNDFTTTTVAVAIVVVLTTPLQAAAEEYLFRGYLLQAVGSLVPSRAVGQWIAVVVTATLFALAHGVQNFPLFFDRFMFGLIAGWLVIRTGGLEAGIALHILNNFLAFGFALAFGDLTEALTVSEVSWWNIPLTLTQSGIYAVLVSIVAARMGLQRRTRPPVPDPVPAVAPAGV